MKKVIIAVLVSLTFVILGCDGGGGDDSSDTTTPAVETTIKTSVTNEEGVAKFVDSSTEEDVNIYISDKDSNTIPGINIEFLDAKNYELFIIEDSTGKYLPALEIYPHNSDHWITMYLPEEKGSDEITELPVDSDKGQAMENFLSDTAGERIYHGRFTPEELDETDEIRMMILERTGIGSFFTFVSQLNDFMEKMDEIFNLGFQYEEPEFYDLYTLIPSSSITTTLCWLEPIINDIICTDTDGDGYFVEGGACGSIDCDDNNYYINPGAEEICNGVDDNCNGVIDEGCNEPICTDTDGDGYAVEGGACGEIDCNDNDYYINPGAEEVYNGIDDNCNGIIDEGCGEPPNAPTNLVVTVISPTVLYAEWQDNSDNEDGFEIKMYILTSSGSVWTTTTTTSNSTYIEQPLSGIEWELQVRAFNDIGNSDWIYFCGDSGDL